MSTTTSAKETQTTLPSASQKKEESKKFSLGQLPDGLYLIARCIDETTRRESSFEENGKRVTRVTYVTGYRCEGATFEHTAYADADCDPAKPVTDRGEPIELVPFGSRVLFSKSTYARDDKTGQKLVQRISGKVLDVQKL